jgi:hypothetical protein
MCASRSKISMGYTHYPKHDNFKVCFFYFVCRANTDLDFFFQNSATYAQTFPTDHMSWRDSNSRSHCSWVESMTIVLLV